MRRVFCCTLLCLLQCVAATSSDVKAESDQEQQTLKLCDTRYHLEREIHAGELTTIWEAQGPKKDQRVAIKIWKDLNDPRSLKEWAALTMLRHHPHVVQLYCHAEIETQRYLVLEWCDLNLKQILATKKKYDVSYVQMEFLPSLRRAMEGRTAIVPFSSSSASRDEMPQHLETD